MKRWMKQNLSVVVETVYQPGNPGNPKFWII